MAEKKKRGFTFPHMFTLILLIITVCTILTYVVPAGRYDTYVDENGVEVFVDGSYHRIEQTPVTPMKALMSVQEGIIETANIAAFIFVIGGAFGVVAETKAIEAGIGRIIKKTSKRQGLLIPIMIFVVGFAAGSFGMFEECLVFIPFLVPICIAMGYDSITGLAVAIVGSSSGYAGSFVQPANVGVSQSIAGLPLYSGMQYRLIILVVMLTIAAVYVSLYARRIKADPTRSLMYEFDRQREEKVDLNDLPELTGTRKVVLLVMGATFALLIVGVLKWGWYINEISGLFLGMGIIVGFVGRVGLNGFGVLFGRGGGLRTGCADRPAGGQYPPHHPVRHLRPAHLPAHRPDSAGHVRVPELPQPAHPLGQRSGGHLPAHSSPHGRHGRYYPPDYLYHFSDWQRPVQQPGAHGGHLHGRPGHGQDPLWQVGPLVCALAGPPVRGGRGAGADRQRHPARAHVIRKKVSA